MPGEQTASLCVFTSHNERGGKIQEQCTAGETDPDGHNFHHRGWVQIPPATAVSCSCPPQVQPGQAAQLHLGRNLDFHQQKGKSNLNSNPKSLPISCFHHFALLSRVSKIVHCPFPLRPRSSQHARTQDCPSKRHVPEDSPSTVKASALDDSRSFQSSRITLESSCPGMQFLQGVHLPCSSRYSLSWQSIRAGKGQGACRAEAEKAERSQPAPRLLK